MSSKTVTAPAWGLDRFGDFAEYTSKELSELKEKIDSLLHGQEDRLLSPEEACKLFQPKISRPTLKKWTDDGFIPQQRIGGRVFYRYTDIINAGSTLKRYRRNE